VSFQPWVIDEGAWSRFQKKYYIPFPSLEQRKEIFLAELQLTPNVVTSGDLERISTWTSGYSGRDIKSLMRECWTGHVQKYKDDFVQGKVVPLELVCLLGL
jgi:SpoVK/Ycf46/Vps4 family AAA+-type ATPase